MQYLLLIQDDEQNWATLPEEGRRRVVAEYLALTEEMHERGVILGSNRLAPVSAASTIRVRDGEEVVTDGPFAETKEQLGGFFLIEVDSVAEAQSWAAKVPVARHGSVEVRPIVPVPAMMASESYGSMIDRPRVSARSAQVCARALPAASTR